MHELQQFGNECNWSIRANGRAERRWHNKRHAGLYVLGRRVSVNQASLYGAAELVRRRCRRRCDNVRSSDSDASVAAELDFFVTDHNLYLRRCIREGGRASALPCKRFRLLLNLPTECPQGE